MKNQKINLHWQSFLVGVVLCAVLVVFIGSKVADPQTGAVQKAVQPATNTSSLMEKSELIDQRVLVVSAKLNQMDEKLDKILAQLNKLNQMDAKIDLLEKTVKNGFNVVDRTLAAKK